MNQRHASAILATLDATWAPGTPASEYPNSKCLGMAISDTGATHVMADVEAEILRAYPGRAAKPPLLPMFNCCGSKVIPAFNRHPDTTLTDVKAVVTSAVAI
jgi:hypothetical protein